MDCVTLMKVTYNGTFSFVGWNKPRIWISVIITETLHSTKNNLLGSCIVSSSSTEQGQWVFCKPAWWLQMAPDISMCRTQQFCGWAIASIAYKRFVPPITIHVVGDLQEPRHHRLGIFTSNTYGIGGDHLQELLQKHQGIITLEYPHRPCVIVSVDLHCMSDTRIEAPSWINCVPAIGVRFLYRWVQVLYLPWRWTSQVMAPQKRALCLRLCYWTGPMGQRVSRALEWNAVMVGMDFSCCIAHSTSNVTWTKWSNLRSRPSSKVIGWHFSRTQYFPSPSPSHRPSLNQMQFIHCPSQHTHCLAPHWASAQDLTDHQMRSRDPPPQTAVQLCLVIQEVKAEKADLWDIYLVKNNNENYSLEMAPVDKILGSGSWTK